MLSPRFTGAAQTVTNLSQLDIAEFDASSRKFWTQRTGRVPLRMVYLFLSRPITLSMCMHTYKILRALSTSSADNCLLPFVKGGVISSAPHAAAKRSGLNHFPYSILIGDYIL